MNKLVSLMIGIIVLMSGGMRSVQAQALKFDPQPAKTRQTSPQSVPEAVESAAIDFQVPQPRPAKSVRTTIVNPSISQPSNENRLGMCQNCGSDQPASRLRNDDRLVAVAPDELFEGGSDSLVAKAVGSAEGTRTPDGGKTWAYHGHVDPGNGAWNMGSFSYQHGATSPDDADRRQLIRLRSQYDIIQKQYDSVQQAASTGLRFGLEEQLNGIDLANQAPLAALDRGGYIDRLRQAYAQGLSGSEAVLHARTYAYINPHTNQWDAPGLGNTFDSINRDQARRQDAIYEAIQSHQQTAR